MRFSINGQMANGMWRIEDTDAYLKPDYDAIKHMTTPPYAMVSDIDQARLIVDLLNVNEKDEREVHNGRN